MRGYSHTGIVTYDEHRARTTNGRVPGVQVSHGNAKFGSNGRTGISRLHLVELVAIGHHASLNWRGSHDARLRAGRSRGGGIGGQDADTNVVADDEHCARASYSWIPGMELGRRNVILACYGIARVSGDDLVELVAGRDHVRLDRGRCGDCPSSGIIWNRRF